MADETPETEEQRTERRKRFVLDFCDGKIFTDMAIERKEDLALCFMVLTLMSEEDIPKDVGRIWEYIDQAGPRSFNGLPCFFSCRFMPKAEWDIVRPAIERELQRRKDIEL